MCLNYSKLIAVASQVSEYNTFYFKTFSKFHRLLQDQKSYCLTFQFNLSRLAALKPLQFSVLAAEDTEVQAEAQPVPSDHDREPDLFM